MKKVINVALLTALVIGAFGVASMSNAQTTLVCNGSASVATNQSVTLTATGGTGTYSWSGQGLTTTSPTGSQFNVSYGNPGTYTVTVTSGTQSANCVVSVVSTSTNTSSLSCSPVLQATNVGQSVQFSATGGNGSYTWSSPDLTISNPTGSGFSANFGSSGTKSVVVQSGSNTATCIVNVTGGTVTPFPPVVPGLPNTGGGYGR